uniref:Putative secreted protein n=1 Tax=Anopheles marajoara TaxID=58244 RepID=A0A2M4C894_9DIPT
MERTTAQALTLTLLLLPQDSPCPSSSSSSTSLSPSSQSASWRPAPKPCDRSAPEPQLSGHASAAPSLRHHRRDGAWCSDCSRSSSPPGGSLAYNCFALRAETVP